MSCDSKHLLVDNSGIQLALDTRNNEVLAEQSLATHMIRRLDHFHMNTKVGNQFTMNPATGVAHFHANHYQTWKCDDQETFQARLHLAKFTLREHAYVALLQEYTNAPLLLPIQCIRHKDYHSALGNQIEFGVTAQPTLKRSNIGIRLFRDD